MTRTNTLGAYVLTFGFLALMGLVVLLLLGPALQSGGGGSITVARQSSEAVVVPGWLADQQTTIPQGLLINSHAEKHRGQKLDAWKIYTLLMEGQCTASANFCGADDPTEKLYLCVDPVTGLVGGLFTIGDEIMTGYGSRSFDYWDRTVVDRFWEVCP